MDKKEMKTACPKDEFQLTSKTYDYSNVMCSWLAQ